MPSLRSEFPHPSKLGIIAGGGKLPLLVIEACRNAGRPFFVIALSGFADSRDYADVEPVWASFGQVGRVLSLLKREGCGQVLMAGHAKRPDFRALKLDWKAAKLLPRVLSAARSGDDALLSLMVQVFEEEGFAVIGADEVVDNLLMPAGLLTAHRPDAQDIADIERGVDVLAAMGALDIGQGVVICHQLVLAVEAVEGTDAMLDRCRSLPSDVRGRPEARRGVLVKMPKPGQERRVDLPTIGSRTVEKAALAGLSGIAVAAGSTLVIDRETLVARANEKGLFVVGFDPDAPGALKRT